MKLRFVNRRSPFCLPAVVLQVEEEYIHEEQSKENEGETISWTCKRWVDVPTVEEEECDGD